VKDIPDDKKHAISSEEVQKALLDLKQIKPDELIWRCNSVKTPRSKHTIGLAVKCMSGEPAYMLLDGKKVGFTFLCIITPSPSHFSLPSFIYQVCTFSFSFHFRYLCAWVLSLLSPRKEMLKLYTVAYYTHGQERNVHGWDCL
jgi:hypothetical protein